MNQKRKNIDESISSAAQKIKDSILYKLKKFNDKKAYTVNELRQLKREIERLIKLS